MMKALLALTTLALSALAHAEVTVVDVEDLGPLLSRGVPLVDVRHSGDQRETGIVPGSRPMSFFDAEGKQHPEEWMQSFATVAGPDDEVIVICRSGAKARIVADYLDQQRKYTKVYAVEGGVIGWKALGKPVATP